MMTLYDALGRLVVLEARGENFHYTSCGIFNQGIITTRKSKDDPTYKCTCGRDEAVEMVASSRIGELIYNEVAKRNKK